MNTPRYQILPRERGATIEIIPPGTPCPVDDALAVNEPIRILRLADFDAYRSGDVRKVTLGNGCNVIRLPRRAEIEPVESNVIYAFSRFTDPTPPTGAPAMARAA
ncbi:hypothetical protein [Pseudogemmobacter sonorensis]|uniref:hypothetical protein n=1 Tax=Pseudogemmobacter sonorensis TaxID=2989681 RepID=UPI0036836A2A